jgi:mannose-6-phosphate isomerase-like protein (cupin superfamily)
MKSGSVGGLVLALACIAGTGAAQAIGRGGRGGPRSTAPPPGSPGIYFSAQQLKTALEAAVAASPSTATSPIGLTDQYYISVVRRGTPAGALSHPGWTELHYILEGGATFVTGGSLKTAGIEATGGGRGGPARMIEGGVERHVSQGDAILVPADTPHWYKEIDGSLTYLEVRFLSPKKGLRRNLITARSSGLGDSTNRWWLTASARSDVNRMGLNSRNDTEFIKTEPGCILQRNPGIRKASSSTEIPIETLGSV